jgi:hypothetical protein
MTIALVKPLLETVPELLPLVKTAAVASELSTRDKASTLLSAMVVAYAKESGCAPTTFEYTKLAEVNTSVDLYGLRDEVAEHTKTLRSRIANTALGTAFEKTASHNTQDLLSAIKSAKTTGSLVKVAQACQQLADTLGEDTPQEIRRYACTGSLNKEAAIAGLRYRSEIIAAPEFEKIAGLLESADVDAFSQDDLRVLGNTVASLDVKYGLTSRFDFFQEAFLEKRAVKDVMVSLGKKTVSVTKVQNVAASLADALGADVVTSIVSADTETAKAVIDSLPLDLKQLLATYA